MWSVDLLQVSNYEIWVEYKIYNNIFAFFSLSFFKLVKLKK